MSDRLLKESDVMRIAFQLPYVVNSAFFDAVKALPSADRPTGEWILECDSEGEGDNLYRCSECGCKYGCQEYDKPNFCLDCNVYMKG